MIFWLLRATLAVGEANSSSRILSLPPDLCEEACASVELGVRASVRRESLVLTRATPSTETTPADDRAMVVSEAWPSSMEPTPIAADVDAPKTPRLSDFSGTVAVSIATSSALTVMPVPAPTVRVAEPEVAPPVRPAPATTSVMSPVPPPPAARSSHEVPSYT